MTRILFFASVCATLVTAPATSPPLPSPGLLPHQERGVIRFGPLATIPLQNPSDAAGFDERSDCQFWCDELPVLVPYSKPDEISPLLPLESDQ